GPFFAGGAGLLGACSHFSDTLLEGAPDRALWARTSSTAILRSVHDERRPTTNAAFSSYFRLRPKRGRRNIWLHADAAERVPEASVAECTTARTAATFSGAAADGVRLREAGMGIQSGHQERRSRPVAHRGRVERAWREPLGTGRHRPTPGHGTVLL